MRNVGSDDSVAAGATTLMGAIRRKRGNLQIRFPRSIHNTILDVRFTSRPDVAARPRPCPPNCDVYRGGLRRSLEVKKRVNADKGSTLVERNRLVRMSAIRFSSSPGY